MPHGHHGGGDAHVVSRTGTDSVGVPDIVHLPSAGRSAVEDQVGAVVLDHDSRLLRTRIWDKARPGPVGGCRSVVRVVGGVELRRRT